MRSPLKLITANIFVAKPTLSLLFPVFKQDLLACTRGDIRYVDDILCVWQWWWGLGLSLSSSFIHCTRHHISHVKRTMVVFLFLVIVHRSDSGFHTSVYQKQTFMSLYTQLNYFCSKQQKVNFSKTFGSSGLGNVL